MLTVGLVAVLAVAIVGAVFLVIQSRDQPDRPRLVVTSAALSSAGVAAVDTAQAGVPFVVRLFGQASGRLTLTLDAACDQLPAVDLVVSTGSAGAVPRSTPACAVAETAWDVAELSADVAVASFVLGVATAPDRTGPAEWRGTMVLALRTDDAESVAQQQVQLSLTGEGGLVVEESAPLLPPSDATTGSTSSTPAVDPPAPAGSPSGTAAPRTSGASSGTAGVPPRPTAGGSTAGGGSGPGTGSSTGGGSTSSVPAPATEPAPSSSPETSGPDPGTPSSEPPSSEPPADLPVDPVVPVDPVDPVLPDPLPSDG